MISVKVIKYSSQIAYRIAARTMSTETNNFIISEETPTAGIITINRPKALNAINLDMVRDIYASLKKWENTKSVVIMRATGGKAFCAGGDIKCLIQTDDKSMPATFMREEYTLNHLIGTYKIPHVALIDGITMGGGVGLSMHGKYRVATEKTLFAMPETAIGLFPDVGGSHVLARLNGKLGMYFGLTGARLKGKDVLACGLASHYCDSSAIPDLTEKLLACKSDKDVNETLRKICISERPTFSLDKDLKRINECFNASSVEDIVRNLEKNGSEWAKNILNTLSKMCPQSLKITHKQIDAAASMNLAQVLQMDYRLVCRILPDYNFTEGVRAMLIEKTNQPNWNPAKLEEMTFDRVASFFEKLPDNLELKLNRPESKL